MKYFFVLLFAGCASQRPLPVSAPLAARRECVKSLNAESIHSASDFVDLGRAQRALAEKSADPEELRRTYRCALAAFEAASVLSPMDPEPVFESAQVSFDLQDFKAAALGFHHALELDPRTPRANLRLAQVARNIGDIPEALAYLDEEKRVNPSSADAWVEQGNIEMSTRSFLAAETQFTQAHKLEPANRDALLGRAVARHLLGSLVAAERDLRAVVKLDPRFADAYWQLGLLHEKMKKNAVPDFREFRRLVDPASPMAARAEAKLRELSEKAPPLR